MSTFVLIHGSWHGGWAWDEVSARLRKAGHTVVAPDLPGHGADYTPVAKVSLKSYADMVCQVLDGLSEPAILVGHSLGGIAISEALERRPEKVQLAVYLAAFLLRDGESLLQVALTDSESSLLPNLLPQQPEPDVNWIKEDEICEIFYHDCDPAVAARAQARLRPEPGAPTLTPVSVSAANFGRVPRIYIETLADRAISPAMQRRMYGATPCDRIISLQTGHSPMLAAPVALVEYLESVAALVPAGL